MLQFAVVSNDSSNLNAKNMETEVENKWCLNFMSDDSKDIVTPNFCKSSFCHKLIIVI